MNSSNRLSRMRLASRLCVTGAWTTLALGFILIILFYVLSNVGNGQNEGPGLEIFIFVEIIIAMLSIFFFLVLYALGALLNYVSASKNVQIEGTIPARMMNLPEEDEAQLEITPIQKMP
jgi:hypothetical protein